MVASCSVCGEQYGVTEDVTFHKFPANEDRRKKWISAVKRGSWLPGKRSMLCSKHFSRDKFVYKISGDKIRRYLMPDTVPTIFDRTNWKLETETSQQLDSGNAASCSNLNDSGADTEVTDVTANVSGSLNLEILASTSVASEPYSIPTESGSIQTKQEIASNQVSESIENPAFVTLIGVAACGSDNSKEKLLREENRLVNYPNRQESVRNFFRIKSVQIQTDMTSLPTRHRQVYPGDFKQLNYSNVSEVSRSWSVQNDCIKKMRNNMKVLRQRNRRLEKRVTDLKSVVKFLKNRIVTRDSAAVQLCGHSDSSVTTEALPKKKDRRCRVPNPLEDHNYISAKNKQSS